jgi:hypothetical protein
MPSRIRSRLSLGVLLGSLLLLLGATGASAATTRFAAPGGMAPAGSACEAANPCSLFNAASITAPGTVLGNDDDVVVESGSYSDAANDLGPNGVLLRQGITVHGAAGQPRPLINLSVADGPTAFFVQSGDVLSHLEINRTARGRSDVSVVGGVVEDLIARSSSANAIVCEQTRGIIRDSACLSDGANSAAVGTTLLQGEPETFTAKLRNVTAVATGAGSHGLSYVAFGEHLMTVDAIGVIARAPAEDVEAGGRSLPPNTPGTGANVEVHLDHSDYADVGTSSDPAEATPFVTPVGSGTNIVAAPRLEADGYHELPNSPTINKGATAGDGSSGGFDIDAEGRALGAAADIGADERPASTVTATTPVCQLASIEVGDATICTVTVENRSASPDAASGDVEFQSDQAGKFSDAGSCLLGDIGGGRASCQITYSPTEVGSPNHGITATFPGDSGHEPGLGTTQVSVPRRRTATTLSCQPSAVLLGTGATTCTAVVSTTLVSPSQASGTVKFMSDGQGAFGDNAACALTPTSGGDMSCRTTYTPSLLGTGNHKITASYQGDSSHGQSQASAQIQVSAPPSPPRTPPNTTLRKRPKAKSAAPLAKFSFGSDQAGASFQCKLDKGPFKPCRSPFKKKVKPGAHAFSVRAVGAAGLVDPTPVTFHWKVSPQSSLRAGRR